MTLPTTGQQVLLSQSKSEECIGCSWGSTHEMLLLPSTMKLWQGYVFTGFCDSVTGEGVSTPVHTGIHPQDQRQTSPDQKQTPPTGRWLLLWTVRILLECILVFDKKNIKDAPHATTIMCPLYLLFQPRNKPLKSSQPSDKYKTCLCSNIAQGTKEPADCESHVSTLYLINYF